MTSFDVVNVDGNKIFYREAGPNKAPKILLLHGFPASSHLFRNLIPLLADRYRDAGVGFDVEKMLSGHGLALISMRERARFVNGKISIESVRGSAP